MIRLMVCKNHQYAKIAWGELFEWQRDPRGINAVRLVYTDDLNYRHLHGVRLDESEVMLCEGWEEGRYAHEAVCELRLRGLNLDGCGRLYYD